MGDNKTESKRLFQYLRKNNQKSIKQRVKIMEHEKVEMENGNLNKFDYKRIKTFEANLMIYTS